ncbi:MAG: DMT family transporter [Calditrichaceae bacterium]
MNSNTKYTPWIVIAILSLIWSSTWLAIKIGLETLPPFLSAGWRFFTAFLVLSIYAYKLKLKFPRDLKSHLFFLLFSLVNFSGGYALVYWGEQYINSGLASVLFSVMPFYVAVFSIKFLPSEEITFKKMLGILIGFAGIVVIFSDQLHISHPYAVYGMIGVLISPAFSAAGTILGKKARATYHPVTMNTLPLLYTGITFFILHNLFESAGKSDFTIPAVLSILYLGIMGTAVAFVLYFWLLKTTSAVLMSLITFITPPLALLWGWMVMGETITLKLVFGMLIIFSGIAVVRKSHSAPKVAPTP